jgi:hypothetical protein
VVPQVFVVGAPRSGTTLTARILGSHPDIFCPGETHFMEDIYSRGLAEAGNSQSLDEMLTRLLTIYARYNEPGDQDRLDRLVGNSDFKAVLRSRSDSASNVFASFMELQASACGKSAWVNHAPKDVFYIDELATMFPECRFILCVRDPRDFLLSYKLKWRATADREVARIRALYHPVITTMLWKASARRIHDAFRRLPEDRVMLQKYEDLVSDPVGQVERLFAFIGEHNVPDTTNLEFSNSSHGRPAFGIHTDSVGRGAQALDRSELWWIRRLLRDDLERFGYDFGSLRPPVGRLLVNIVTLPVSLSRALIANRHKTGPILPYLFRRLRGLLAGS